MKQAIDAAVYLEADTVCTLIAQGFYDPALYNIMTRKEAWDMIVSGVKECAQYAKERGMTISIEILQGTSINSVDQLVQAVQRSRVDNVFVTVDTGTFYTTIKPKMPIKEAIHKLGKHINCVHVKDEVGFPNIMQCQHVWYGAGYVDFKEMAQALKEVDYSGYCAVEWEGGKTAAYTAWAIPAASAWQISIWWPPRQSFSWRKRGGTKAAPRFSLAAHSICSRPSFSLCLCPVLT